MLGNKTLDKRKNNDKTRMTAAIEFSGICLKII